MLFVEAVVVKTQDLSIGTGYVLPYCGASRRSNVPEGAYVPDGDLLVCSCSDGLTL